MTKLIVAFILALSLSACGYHLRGASTLPAGLNIIYLEGGSAQLREQFERLVKSASGKLVKSPEKAQVVIKIVDDRIRRRVLSLSERGRSNELELDYRLEYELSKSGEVLLAGEPVNIRREYFNDQRDIIAKDNEEKVIRSEIYHQAAEIIINRARMALSAK